MAGMDWVLAILGGYLAIGGVFAVAFVTRGAGRIDANAGGAGWGFRLLAIPGSAALWPWLASRWTRSRVDSLLTPRDTLAHRRVHLVAWCVIPVVVVAIVAWGWFGGVDPTAAGGVTP